MQRYQDISFIFALYSFLFISFYMSVLDIIMGGILVYSLFKGFQNGLFVELASLISLVLGIYFAIKFSSILAGILTGFSHWNPKTIQIVAFVFTFVLVIIAMSILAKFLTKIANFAHLGCINNIGGGFVHVLKMVLILGIVLNLFEKINYKNFIAKRETLDKSLFYNPVRKTAGYMYPSLEKWYGDLKKK